MDSWVRKSVPQFFLFHSFDAKPCCEFAHFSSGQIGIKNISEQQGFAFVLAKYGVDLPSHNVSASPSFPGLTFHTQALG